MESKTAGVIGVGAATALALYLMKKKPCSHYNNLESCEQAGCWWWENKCQGEIPFGYGNIYNNLGFCSTGDGLRLGYVTKIAEDEYNIHESYYNNFFMTGVLGKNLVFHYHNPVSHYTTPLPDHDGYYQNLVTGDGKVWERITDYEYDSINDLYSFRLTPLVDTIQISMNWPYSYRAIQYSIHSKSYLPYVHVSTIGKSVQNRNIDMMEITNFNIPDENKFHIVCITRQHPCEKLASFLMDGCISHLLSKSIYRNLLHWYFIPAMNPDGIYLGHTRCNYDNIDTNRSWNKNPGDFIPGGGGGTCDGGYTPEVDYVRTRLQEIANSYGIDFFIDMHSQGGIGYPSYISSSAANNWCTPFSELCQERTGIGYVCHQPYNSGNEAFAQVYAANVLGVVPHSFTLECSQVDWHYTLPILREHGKTLADSIYQLFYESG